MNVTELARILKITPQELRDWLPQLGFDIGQKAIKINRTVANRIIKKWPVLKNEMAALKQQSKAQEEEKQATVQVKKTITVPRHLTVKKFSLLADIPVNKILAELMKNGIFTSLNESIDYETAWLVGSELNLTVQSQADEPEEKNTDENQLKKIIANEAKTDLRPRPPVIVVMGHVDHGKTKLLDTIRRTHVIDTEAGGITQHIGAYQVKRRNKLLTFIDTPGHEAFTAMRSRGAKIADIAILVVAADDGVKPQTIEAYRIIKAANIPFIVAINKIDKDGADAEKTKKELADRLNILPEDWGGKAIISLISAKEGTGINELLDIVLLAADTEADNIIANPNAAAVGMVIESHLSKDTGPVATILIQNGTLYAGDQLTLAGMVVGKVRCLNNYRGEKIDQAEPAAPAQIIGLKTLPQVGDMLQVGEGERVKTKKRKGIGRPTMLSKQSQPNEEQKNIRTINVIIKSDVLGSAEAIEESLEKINTDVVQIKIIRKGLGNITDGDIKRAEAAKAQIIGFNVKCPPAMEELAREKQVIIKLYNIIYHLINDIKEQLRAIIEPTITRKNIGRLKVLAIFKTGKDNQIIGGKITAGWAETGSLVDIKRGKEVLSRGKITKLQCGRQDVTRAEAGQECGVEYAGDPIIAKDDILEIQREEKITQKIN